MSALWSVDYGALPGWQAVEQPTTGRLAIVSQVPGYASRWKPTGNVLRAELRPGEVFVETSGYRAPRAEVYARHAVPGSTPPAQWPDPPGSVRWYDWALLIPAGFVFTPDADPWFVATQFKGHLGGGPPVNIEIKRQNLRLGGTRTNAGLIPGDGNLGAIRPGSWTRLTVGIRYATDQSGWVQVYRDGLEVLPRTPVATLDVVNGQPDPCYLKQGIYRDDAWTVPHTLYYGPVTVTDTPPL